MSSNRILGVFSKNSLLLCGLIGIVITMIASSMILSTTMERHQSFARCQNGYHISPSGVCEQVIQPSTELPRCPNGYHRSPSLDCEQVTSSSINSPYQNPSSPYQQQPQYPQQPQQFSQPQSQQAVPLYNEPQVMACLHKSLADSIVKAGITGALTLHNSTNGTVTAVTNETFLTSATNSLDACIIPISR
jgi:hypothetical protein